MNSKGNSARLLFEALLVIVLSIGGIQLLPKFETVFSLIPVIYLLIERRLRNRSWEEIGFKRGFREDLRANIGWALMVILLQVLTLLWAHDFFPAYDAHIRSRLPVDAAALLGMLPILAVAVLGEEMSYRALLQNRLVPFLGAAPAILLASLVFGMAHFSAGPVAVVTLDVTLIVIDAVIYGLIYQRSRNIYIAWLAHMMGDVVALTLMVSVLAT